MLNPRSIYQTADRDRSSTPLVSDDDASFAHASTPWLAGASPRPFLLVLEAFFRDDARMACRIHTTPHWASETRMDTVNPGRRHGVFSERKDTKPSINRAMDHDGRPGRK
jgi:hypothetical protein